MTTEEKAKKYDEALRQIKECTPDENGFITIYPQEIFPELAESEDEKIRKVLVDLVKCNERSGYTLLNNVSTSSMLAWLKKQGQEPKKTSIWKHWKDGIAGNGDDRQIYLIKTGNIYDISSCLGCECDYIELSELDNLLQGELKETPCDKCKKGLPSHSCQDITALGRCYIENINTSNKVDPKFHEGDWVVYKNDVCQIVKREEGCNKLVTTFGIEKELVNERNLSSARLWTIQEANDGDVLCYETKNELRIFIYKNGHVHYHCCYYNGHLTTVDSYFIVEKYLLCYIHPATIKQRDLFFQKIKEAGYVWDANKKELKKFHVIDEGKAEMDYCFTKMMNGEKVSSAWSEEDEKNIRRIDSLLYAIHESEFEDIHAWIKSLKDRVQPQNKWKPSKEQIIALRWILNNIPYNKHKEEISGLLDQIKVL